MKIIWPLPPISSLRRLETLSPGVVFMHSDSGPYMVLQRKELTPSDRIDVVALSNGWSGSYPCIIQVKVINGSFVVEE